MWDKAKGYVADHPGTDWAAAALAMGAYLVFHYSGWSHPHVAPAASTLIYQTLTLVGAALLGLVFTAVAVVRTLDPGKRLGKLQAVHGSRITRSMMAVIRGLGVATLLLGIDMVLDQPGGYTGLARSLAVLGGAIMTLSMVRLSWLFGLILGIHDADQRAAARKQIQGPPVSLVPEHRPAAGE